MANTAEQTGFALPDNLSPDSIDTLTELSAILARFRPAFNAPNLSVSTPNLANLAGLPGSTPAAHGGGGGGGGGAVATPAPGARSGSTPAPGAAGPNLKDLPAATDNLKHKLQRARIAIQKLPDMNRDLEAQEVEIALLEEKKRKQIAELLKIKEEGEQFVQAEQMKKDQREKMVA